MTTTYYTPSGLPSAETRGISAQVRAEFLTIASAFTSLNGDLTTSIAAVNSNANTRGLIAGQTWAGTHNFPATTYGVTAAFGSSGTALATLDYVNAVATNAALPGQAGNAGKLPITNGTTVSWSGLLNTGVIRLADSADATKQVAFDASALTTAATRTVTVPDRNLMLGGFTHLAVLSSTQTWTAPAWCSLAEVTVVDGGQGGSQSSGGSATDYSYACGKGGDTGIAVLAITPGSSYTATIGAGGAASGGAGGATSFAGPGLTALTSANATLKIAGQAAYAGGLGQAPGGITPFGLNPAGAGYGTGGQGGTGNGGAGSGKSGVVIIRY